MVERRKTDGFTLIEMAIVIAIIAILAAVAVPKMSSLSEDADAETVRAIVADVEMSINEGTNRGIPYADLKATTGHLNDIVALAQEAFPDRVTITASGAGTIKAAITQSAAARSATLTMQNDGSVKITAVSGFSHYTLVSGDLKK